MLKHCGPGFDVVFVIESNQKLLLRKYWPTYCHAANMIPRAFPVQHRSALQMQAWSEPLLNTHRAPRQEGAMPPPLGPCLG